MFNRKKPRLGKKDFSVQVFTKDLFEKFKKEYPEHKGMSWKDFKQRWLEIAETIRDEALMNPLGVKLNFYLGELKTQFLPYKYEAVDRDVSEKEGDKIKHLNLLTRGKTAKIIWQRREAGRYNSLLEWYGFENHREINQKSKNYIPDNIDKLRVARVTIGGKRKLK